MTASTKSWLFDVRESGAKVGKLALEQMGTRIKKWRARREKEGGVRLARVGGALELVNNERVECTWSKPGIDVRGIAEVADQLTHWITRRSRSIFDRCISVYTSTKL